LYVALNGDDCAKEFWMNTVLKEQRMTKKTNIDFK
jgi:hypothetical protein